MTLTEIFVNGPSPGQLVPLLTLANNGGQISSNATTFEVAEALPEEYQTTGSQFHALIAASEEAGEVVIIPTQPGTTLSGIVRAASPESDAMIHLDGAGIYPVLTAEALANGLVVGPEGPAGAPGVAGATGPAGPSGAVAINTAVTGATGGKLLVTDTSSPTPKAQEGPALSLVALTTSPAFTGAPTAPTAPSGDSSNKLATTAFVATAVAAGGAGGGGNIDGGSFASAGTGSYDGGSL